MTYVCVCVCVLQAVEVIFDFPPLGQVNLLIVLWPCRKACVRVSVRVCVHACVCDLFCLAMTSHENPKHPLDVSLDTDVCFILIFHIHSRPCLKKLAALA